MIYVVFYLLILGFLGTMLSDTYFMLKDMDDPKV